MTFEEWKIEHHILTHRFDKGNPFHHAPHYKTVALANLWFSETKTEHGLQWACNKNRHDFLERSDKTLIDLGIEEYFPVVVAGPEHLVITGLGRSSILLAKSHEDLLLLRMLL